MDDKLKKKLDLLIKIILIIIIILLLIRNCTLLKKNREYKDNKADIIEIKCDNNACKLKKIESINFSQEKYNVKVGDTINLVAIIKPSELSGSKLTWTSSDPSVATVSSNGKIKGLSIGKTLITVTSANGKTATCTIEVVNDSVNIKKINLVRDKSVIDAGSVMQINAIIEPANATERNLVWISSNPGIAIVDNNGVVKGLKAGTVTITAKTKDGKIVASTTIKIQEKVPTEVESISFSQDNVSVKKDETINLVAIIKPSELSGSKLTWTSSNPDIATVDTSGKVKGLSVGKTSITVTTSNGKKATCVVEVVNDSVNVEKINLVPDKSVIDTESMSQISVTIEPANATDRDLVWTSSDPSIATVDSNGVVKGLKAGTVTITAKTKDGKVMASTTITIQEKSPTEVESVSFSQDSYSVKTGDVINLIAIIKPSELSDSKLTWTSSNPSIATVDSNGKVKGVSVGKTSITVTTSNGKKATCTVEVVNNNIAVEEIVLIPDEAVISIDSSTQVIAEISPANATDRDLVWTSSDPSIATVSSNGVVNGLKAGTVTITARTKDGKVVATTTITVEDGEFEVYDGDSTPLSWNGASNLNIFSKTPHTKDGRIAPESSNTYQFIVKNSTMYNIKYQIKFTETNDYNINMQYKLKKNDTYIVDHYVKVNELNVNDIVLTSGESDTDYLEWKWSSSNNDTNIGQSIEASYGLKIEIEAEGTNG